MRINSHILSAVEFRSDALGALASIVHPINRATPTDPGYEGVTGGKIFREGAQIATFVVTSADSTQIMQVMIDLSRSKGTHKSYPINSRGFLTFFVSTGPGDYHVVLERDVRVGRQERELPYDTSERLEPGDYFAVSLVRPGTYSLKNAYPRPPVVSEITLDPAEPARAPLVRPSPVVVACTTTEFRFTLDGKPWNPAKDHLTTNQGLTFQILAHSRIILRHNGDEEEQHVDDPFRKVRWLNPKHVEAEESSPTPRRKVKVTPQRPAKGKKKGRKG